VSTTCSNTSVLPDFASFSYASSRRLMSAAGDASNTELVFEALLAGALSYPDSLVKVYETLTGAASADVRTCWILDTMLSVAMFGPPDTLVDWTCPA
jgi:hypothetical protein